MLVLQKLENEYGKATRQLSVRAKSTKDNPGTLPISAYGNRMFGRNPLTSLEEICQDIRTEGNTSTSKEVKEEKREDVNDIRVTFDGSADNEAECNVVLAKGSVVLISQDDQVSGSFLFGSETKNYGESEDSCLFT